MNTADMQSNPVKELREDLEDPVLLRGSWQGRGIDDTLQAIVDLANSDGLEATVTLTIGGSQIMGILTSVQNYFDLLIHNFAEAAKSENIGAINVSNLLENRRPPKSGPLGAQFIHLRDARFYNGDAQPVISEGILWRGKISSIDGFSFGAKKHKP